MKKMNKKITCAILAATMLGTALTGCGKEKKLDGTQIVATIDEHEVTLGLAHLILRENQASSEDFMEQLQEVYGAAVIGDVFWDDLVEDGSMTYGEQQKENVMGTICELYAFKNHAADYNVEVTEEDSQKIAAAAAQFMKDNTQETIDALGVSESDIVTYLELLTIRGKMYEPMLADVDRKVSDDDANQTTVTYVEVSTLGTERDDEGILIPLTDEEKAEKKALAEKIIEAIQKEKDIAKADIEKIAKGISNDVTVSTKSYTTAKVEDQYAIKEAVYKTAAKMKDGEVYAEPVEGSDVYYVIRLDAALDKEATEAAREEIIAQREADAHDALAEKWVYETEVDLDYGVWAQVELTDRQSFRYVVDEEESEESKEENK